MMVSSAEWANMKKNDGKEGQGMVINRRVLRGFALDDQCKDFGGIIREADGKGDPRRFCTGYSVDEGGKLQEQCAICKAYIGNVTPWDGERNGVLPGQISIEEYMKSEDEKERGKAWVCTN